MSNLELVDIRSYYGNIQALDGVSLEVNDNEIVTLIGANGAGKSTTLRTISGLIRPRTGSVVYDGQAINGLPAHEIVMLGVCQVPEGRRIFARMSVRENLEMGAFARREKSEIAADLD